MEYCGDKIDCVIVLTYQDNGGKVNVFTYEEFRAYVFKVSQGKMEESAFSYIRNVIIKNKGRNPTFLLRIKQNHLNYFIELEYDVIQKYLRKEDISSLIINEYLPKMGLFRESPPPLPPRPQRQSNRIIPFDVYSLMNARQMNLNTHELSKYKNNSKYDRIFIYQTTPNMSIILFDPIDGQFTALDDIQNPNVGIHQTLISEIKNNNIRKNLLILTHRSDDTTALWDDKWFLDQMLESNKTPDGKIMRESMDVVGLNMKESNDFRRGKLPRSVKRKLEENLTSPMPKEKSFFDRFS